MQTLINREEELMLIEDAITTLHGGQRLLRTPLIEFYGVEGIGKTTLLRQVEEQCKNKQLPYIWVDMDQNSPKHFLGEIRKMLEEKGPIVVILDSLDDAKEEVLSEIESGLSDLVDNSNLFVVLASKKIERFDNTRSLTRKLTVVPLKPLNRKSCYAYLDTMGSVISPKIRDAIYEWTAGYPLAMDVMVQAIVNNSFDPDNEVEQRQLISLLIKRVIDESLLSNVNDLTWHRTILSLLSVPRRFNLMIMKDIIERFAPPDYQLPSSLAYFGLATKINLATNVLSWDASRGGYSIDSAVRNIFLLQLRIVHTQQYYALHSFLAQLNARLAKEVTGIDRIRYLREFFYHLAKSGDDANISLILTQHLEQFIQEEALDSLIQFSEEFLQDEELQETLGENTDIVLSLMQRKLMKI